MRFGNDRLQIELDEDSALDIGSVKVDGVEIAPGKAVPDDGDPRILKAVAGFLFTCGPDHIRHPESVDDSGATRFPLHGSLSGTRAEIIDEQRNGDTHDVTARMTLSTAQGGEAEIVRRWEYDARTMEVSLQDRVVNTGSTSFPLMLMYHINIGAHLFDERTMLAGASFDNGAIGWHFGEGDNYVFCGPAVAESDSARVRLGPIAAIGGKALNVRFATDTLPYLQMWRNQAGHCNVLGIEPVSHPWKKRPDLMHMGLMTPLEPGAARTFSMGFCFR